MKYFANKNVPTELFLTHCVKASCMYVVFDIKSRVLWWSVHIIHARRNLLLDTSWCITLVWNNNPSLTYFDKRISINKFMVREIQNCVGYSQYIIRTPKT